MAFDALTAHLPRRADLPCAEQALAAMPAARLGSFADDITLASGERLCVRAVAKGSTQRLTLDFRDSDAFSSADGFGLDHDDLELVAVLALCHALGVPPDRRWLERLELLSSPNSWVGGIRSSDPGRRAFALARTFDAVLGALAYSWPARVGAGSNTLGAVVEIRRGADIVCEAIPGGEGATPARRGQSGWRSPVVGAVSTARFFPWLSLTQRGRAHSGGGGARPGGDGIERVYTVTQDVEALFGFDRDRNPPHGIDRAGPPRPSRVFLERRGQDPKRVTPWIPLFVPAGASVRVETAGGAGHGFGGYGDIEFDPADWFGSKSSDEPSEH
ncbi:MAG: hydantoinase B/oxoprolinase family protein [Nannocystales bacterium]